MYGLDGQHQYVDRTLRGRVSQNDRDVESTSMVWPNLRSRMAKEQSRTFTVSKSLHVTIGDVNYSVTTSWSSCRENNVTNCMHIHFSSLCSLNQGKRGIQEKVIS